MISLLTDDMDHCFFCGRPADCEHHLISDRQIENWRMKTVLRFLFATTAIPQEKLTAESMITRWLKSFQRCLVRWHMKKNWH